MAKIDDEQVRQRLAVLVASFDGAPGMLADFLLQHAACKQAFLQKVQHAGWLRPSVGPAPTFYDIDTMLEHYDGILQREQGFVDMEADVTETPAERQIRLLNHYLPKLQKAIAEEDYEQAIRIRDNMRHLGLRLPE